MNATDLTDAARAVLEERARRLARPRPLEEPPDRFVDAFHFGIGSERFAIAASFVRRVFPLVAVTPLPALPRHLLGVVNGGGHLLPVVDLRALIGGPDTELASMRHAVVCGRGIAEIAIPATSAAGIAPRPRLEFDHVGVGYTPPVRSVGADALVVLDGAALLEDPRLFATHATASLVKSENP